MILHQHQWRAVDNTTTGPMVVRCRECGRVSEIPDSPWTYRIGWR